MAEISEFVLWGSAGHAKVLAELISLRGGRVVALFDNGEVCSVIPGVPLVGGENDFRDWINDREPLAARLSGLAAIGGGRGSDRLKVQALFREHDLLVPTICHPSATVSRSVRLGAGTQVLALASIASDSQLGEACIINHKASVDHECIIGDGVHLAPGATLCGCVSIANNVFVGAGAVVLPRIRIGENSIIGAGAVVTKDILPGIIVVGNPARPIECIKKFVEQPNVEKLREL
jgi:sugar O-acyltransferase (sialic acid O-acetyltransferase NeuD family)